MRHRNAQATSQQSTCSQRADSQQQVSVSTLVKLERLEGAEKQDLKVDSGILSPLKHFAYDVRQIVQRQTLPGYQLLLTRDPKGTERLNFAPTPLDPLMARLRQRGLIPNSEDNL